MLDYRSAKGLQEEMLRRSQRSTTQSVSREASPHDEGKLKPAGLVEPLRHGARTLFKVPRFRGS